MPIVKILMGKFSKTSLFILWQILGIVCISLTHHRHGKILQNVVLKCMNYSVRSADKLKCCPIVWFCSRILNNLITELTSIFRGLLLTHPFISSHSINHSISFDKQFITFHLHSPTSQTYSCSFIAIISPLGGQDIVSMI